MGFLFRANLRAISPHRSPREVLQLRISHRDPSCKRVEGANLDHVSEDADALPAKLGRSSWCVGDLGSPAPKEPS